MLLSKPKYILNKQRIYGNLFSRLGYLHILRFSGKYSIYFYNFQNVLYTFLPYINWHSGHLFMSAAFAFSNIITFTIGAKDYSLHTLIILSKTQFQMWWWLPTILEHRKIQLQQTSKKQSIKIKIFGTIRLVCLPFKYNINFTLLFRQQSYSESYWRTNARIIFLFLK